MNGFRRWIVGIPAAILDRKKEDKEEDECRHRPRDYQQECVESVDFTGGARGAFRKDRENAHQVLPRCKCAARKSRRNMTNMKVRSAPSVISAARRSTFMITRAYFPVAG